MRHPIQNFLLWLSFLALAAAVFWFELTPSERLAFEAVLFKYRSIFAALATILLVSVLALWTTIISDQNADRREHFNRSTLSQLKLSEFRQEWINEIRSDLSNLISLASVFDGNESERKERMGDAKKLDARIRLRLHLKDEPSESDGSQPEDLDAALIYLVDSLEKVLFQNSNTEQRNQLEIEIIERRQELADVANKFLKREWEELKTRLSRADRRQFL